ncbi:unnamed protein product [Gongylonema pulchrum]|uniref:50S ribosomal protein L23 n=1 Tax=Gongylonema pulchrum TaxID=637853 RepID=A0A183EMK7_9BILA|nr:unnamed protein product [Gongylonema pulchrum]
MVYATMKNATVKTDIAEQVVKKNTLLMVVAGKKFVYEIRLNRSRMLTQHVLVVVELIRNQGAACAFPDITGRNVN